MKQSRLWKHKHWVVATTLIILVTVPTLPSYYFGEKVMFQNHDNLAHLVRLWHLEQALQHWVIAPTWLTSLAGGLGSPLFLYNWFLPYYLVMPFRLLGLSLADSIKALFLATYIISGLAIYLFAEKITNRRAALVAIPFYLLNPYTLNVTFTRGGVGEAMAHAILPLVFLFTLSKNAKGISFSILTLVGLTLTHNVMALMTYGLLGLWLIFESPTIRKKIIINILLALSFTAFFWIPALLERNLTHFEVAQQWYHQQFPSLKALLSSPWQYGPPQPERQNLSMSFQIGKIHWLVVAMTPLLLLKRQRLANRQKRITAFVLITLVFSILLQLKISEPAWDVLLPLRIIIFPWRLQAVTVFCISILAALLINKSRFVKLAVVGSIILLLVANRNHFYTARGDYAADKYISNLIHAGDSSGEFLPKWADLNEYRHLAREQIDSGDEFFQDSRGINLSRGRILPAAIYLDVKAEETREVILNQYYFPTWVGFIDNRRIRLSPLNGRISFILPEGDHSISLRFRKSALRRIAATFSVVSLTVALAHKMYSERKKAKQRA